MKRVFVTLAIGTAMGAALVCIYPLQRAYAEVEELSTRLETDVSEFELVKETLMGQTRYKEYLSAGEKQIAGHARLVTATVSRPESYLTYVTRGFLGINFNATVEVTYDAHYSFGYDLSPQNYSVQETANGIEIVLKTPVTLVAIPAATNLKGKVLHDGIVVNGGNVLAGVFPKVPQRLQAQGQEMTKDPAVIALSEKRLVVFLRDFLAKQPGVKVIPHISVRYAPKPQAQSQKQDGPN